VSAGLREIAQPFIAAATAGTRVRTRLRVSDGDAAVLRAVGRHLGCLAGRDLAARCRQGRLDAKGRAESRRERKRALTAQSSARWAGAITRTSEDAWQLADRNLHAERASLAARVNRIESRLAVTAGQKQGRIRGYRDQNERHAKTIRLKTLTTTPVPAVTLEELRQHPVVAVDVNAGHLAVAVLRPDGNVTGTPFTVSVQLAGLPTATRDGRVRAAISVLTATAKQHGANAVVIENLDFAAQRAEGREHTGNRPSRGRRGKKFRHLVAGIPTAKFRDRLVQMTFNAGLRVIVVDPAYTSRWGAEHWLAPLREHHPEISGHHAASVVIGKRGQGHRARRRANGNLPAPEDAARPARARPRTKPAAKPAPRKPAAPRGTRLLKSTKTGPPHRTTAGNQAAQDRSGPPAEQETHPCSVLRNGFLATPT